MGIKSNRNKFALSSAIITATLMMMTMTTTAYAQPQGQGRGACPEGTTLNRGVCQAEPEATCDPYGYPPHRIQLTEDGQCKIENYSLPLCEEGEYDWWHNQCENPAGFESNFPTENQDISCAEGKELQFVDVDWVCVSYEYIPAIIEDCSVGTLNTESGMCEVKPGNRNRA